MVINQKVDQSFYYIAIMAFGVITDVKCHACDLICMYLQWTVFVLTHGNQIKYTQQCQYQ